MSTDMSPLQSSQQTTQYSKTLPQTQPSSTLSKLVPSSSPSTSALSRPETQRVDQQAVIPQPNATQSIRNAKDTEYEGVFQAQRSHVPETMRFKAPTSPYIEQVMKQTFLHVLARKLKQTGKAFNQKDLEQFVSAYFSGKNPSLPEGITREWIQKTVTSLKKNETVAQKNLEAQSKELHTIVAQLCSTIRNCPANNHKQAVKDSLKLLRKAYTSQAYAFLCHDENHPDIRVLHNMALATLISPTPLDAYKNLHMPKTDTSSPISDSLRTLRDQGIQAGYASSHNTVEYFFTHPLNALSSLKSESGGQYDPRAETGNLTGSLYDESVTKSGSSTHRRTVYTPTPTIGNSVSPETHMVLQALENRNFMDQETLKSDPFPYTNWVYTNLQDVRPGSEKARSEAIMDLNNQYPLSFTGITVSVDSPFYRGGLQGSNAAHFREQKEKSANEPFDETYIKKMIQELSEPHYVFPIKSESEKAQWEEAKKEIANKAYELITSTSTIVSSPKNDAEKLLLWEQKTAFRELVTLGVIRYWQCKGSQDNSTNILCSNVCKECIDRGSTKNSALLWALGGSNEDVLLGLLGRALLARYRLILPDRLEPFVALANIMKSGGEKAFASMQTYLRNTIGEIAGATGYAYSNAEPLHKKLTATPKTSQQNR